MPSWLCLSRLVFGAGCGTRLYWLLIIALLSTFHSQPKLRAVAGFWKVVRSWDAKSVPPSAEGTRRGVHKRGFSPLVRGFGGSRPRKFEVQKGCRCIFIASWVQFRFINSVNFVGMLEEIFLIIVTFEHLTTQTYWTQLFLPLTESRWDLEESCF